MPVTKGREAFDLLSEVTKILAFKYCKINFATMKHVCNEFANFIETDAVHFDTNWQFNLTEMLPVIGMDGVVLRTHHRYTHRIAWCRASLT